MQQLKWLTDEERLTSSVGPRDRLTFWFKFSTSKMFNVKEFQILTNSIFETAANLFTISNPSTPKKTTNTSKTIHRDWLEFRNAIDKGLIICGWPSFSAGTCNDFFWQILHDDKSPALCVCVCVCVWHDWETLGGNNSTPDHNINYNPNKINVIQPYLNKVLHCDGGQI